jgi:2-C-methyl-D-erythritol 4-phosphate cytidylyltransferase
MLSAIIVAAGSSRRLGFDKLTALLGDKPVISHAVEAFAQTASVQEIVIVTRPDRISEFKTMFAATDKVNAVIAGGEHRHDSVQAGLEHLSPQATFVAVHDGARPLVMPSQIEEVFHQARKCGAAALAEPVRDTLKRADSDLRVRESIDRDQVYAMQTPQIFERKLLEKSYRRVAAGRHRVTDEASAVELLGHRVILVPNDQANLKITYERDLALADAVISRRRVTAAAGKKGEQESTETRESLLERIGSGNLGQLMQIWAARGSQQWIDSPEVYQQLTRRLLAQGEPLLAYDVVAEALKLWPLDVTLRQLQGLSLARSGATERANSILQQLRDEGATDEETLGMLARTYKDLAGRAPSPEREQLLNRAADIYGEAFERSGGFWTGINAATMNLLIGNESSACALAQKVRDECRSRVNESPNDCYWEYAALGEAALICRDWSDAERWYARAAEIGKTRYGDLQSSRRNARLILNHWQKDPSLIDRRLSVPAVIVFAGHMIDRPHRPNPRFPADQETAIANEIRAAIEKVKPGFGFSSAACGSDILFLESMLNFGAEVAVVLPYAAEQFIVDSVDIIPGGNWRARFERVVSNAARVITASTERLSIGGVSYEYCNELLVGLASIRARQLDTGLVPLAVWDGSPGDGPGGAASVVHNWESLGLKPVIIQAPCSAEASRPTPAITSSTTESARLIQSEYQFTARIVSMLFADAVGFSKLSEKQVPRFIVRFLGTIDKLSRCYAEQILATNTWGDGLYLVLREPAAAGNFALELAKLAAGIDGTENGLGAGLSLRIALHAGPVYEFIDPITGRPGFSGTHVSRAARIEPITPPGQVYASESFAAVAAAHGAKHFTCDYVGQTALAKDYGTLAAYHVRPA